MLPAVLGSKSAVIVAGPRAIGHKGRGEGSLHNLKGARHNLTHIVSVVYEILVCLSAAPMLCST